MREWYPRLTRSDFAVVGIRLWRAMGRAGKSRLVLESMYYTGGVGISAVPRWSHHNPETHVATER